MFHPLRCLRVYLDKYTALCLPKSSRREKQARHNDSCPVSKKGAEIDESCICYRIAIEVEPARQRSTGLVTADLRRVPRRMLRCYFGLQGELFKLSGLLMGASL